MVVGVAVAVGITEGGFWGAPAAPTVDCSGAAEYEKWGGRGPRGGKEAPEVGTTPG